VRTARNYLISFGISAARITSKAFGMNNPSIYNTDRALTWMNRRVEILFIKE
jgi:outer membrane protein OmpA-like peptidoglycan-associated protein